ncbi:TPA: hypothetical protein ACNEXA_002580 [Escherichia coli]
MLNFDPSKPYATHDFFSMKNLDELNTDELAYVHLYNIANSIELKNCYLSSSLHDLRETLSASFNNNRTNQYVPLMTSFAMMDQMGTLYTPKGKSSNKKNGIKRCLELNTNLPSNDIESLVSLRNGLLHNGSLLCEAQHVKQTNVIYRLTKKNNILITHPKITWDGVFHDNLNDYTSTIDLIKLRDLVFEIHDKLFNLLILNDLKIEISNTKELYFKYLFARHKTENI